MGVFIISMVALTMILLSMMSSLLVMMLLSVMRTLLVMGLVLSVMTMAKGTITNSAVDLE
jgi:hypothetical protein